jgi:hypothetical protein
MMLASCSLLILASVTHAQTRNDVQPPSISISKNRPVTLVLPNETIPSEETAADELNNYLSKMTGATCKIVREGSSTTSESKLAGTLIYLGPTQFATQYLKNEKAFGGEEWLLQNAGGRLIIAGGRPRGTLYGVYHFLEDICGVRWWTRWEETVPKREQIKIQALHRREKPAFSYRDIYREYHGQSYWDNGRTAARARLNRDGDNPMSSLYGGANAYGPPEHTHTAVMYISKDKYFSDHPDWFALVGGRRMAGWDVAQIDYTNPEMRAEFLRLLLENIRTSRATAIARQLPPPTIYAVDQGDSTSWCECERCAALVQREGSQAGPIIDFVNYMAEGIHDEFPDVLLSTLAYQASEVPPKTLRPHKNVVVKLTDTTNNYTDPVTAPANHLMHERIEAWAAKAERLQIWDYATFYTINTQNLGFPFPSEHTFGQDYRFYLDKHIDRVFVELENTILGDSRDLKLWLIAKLLENPQADDQKLIREFSDGFYGAAGPHFRRYRTELRDAAVRNKADLKFFGAISAFSYVKLSDALKMQQSFDAAEKAVAGNPILLRRVRHARLSLDRLTLFFYPAFLKQHEAAGGTAATLPLKPAVIGQRALQTWIEQIQLRLPADIQAKEIENAQLEIKRYLELPQEFPLPQRFNVYSREQVIDLPVAAMAFKNDGGMKSVVVDAPDAPTGKAEFLNFDEEGNKSSYEMPMRWGFYNSTTRKDTKLPPLKKEDIVGPGYHWYKMGTIEDLDAFFAYFTWSWNIQCTDNYDIITRTGRNGRHDVWANIKFEGPMHGFTTPGQKNSVYVERVILTPAQP